MHVIIPVLQMKKQRLRGVEEDSQVHRAGKWQSQD